MIGAIRFFVMCIGVHVWACLHVYRGTRLCLLACVSGYMSVLACMCIYARLYFVLAIEWILLACFIDAGGVCVCVDLYDSSVVLN